MGMILTLAVVICVSLTLYFHAKFYTTAIVVQRYDKWFIKVGHEYVDLLDMVNTNSPEWPMMLWKLDSEYFQHYIGVYGEKYAYELLPVVQARVDSNLIYVHQQGRFYYVTPESVFNWKYHGRSLKFLVARLKVQNWSK